MAQAGFGPVVIGQLPLRSPDWVLHLLRARMRVADRSPAQVSSLIAAARGANADREDAGRVARRGVARPF
eukprot:582249-Lingulodinium_polyedra.AAC.1